MHRLLPLLLILSLHAAAAAQTSPHAPLPDTPQPVVHPLKVRDPDELREAPAVVNGRPYMRPTQREYVHDYLQDSYGLPAQARTLVRTLYNFGLDQPSGWGQDFPGFMQRFGSNAAITAINGNVRLGMEELFHEDLRYIPCHGCNAKHKIENALLAEFTARHARDGHRFFTLTPVVADFSGPIIAHASWYPNGFNPFGGVVATRTVFATRVGSHLFREFVLERRHYDPHEPPRPPRAAAPIPLQEQP
jgi:hypothetical protein